MSDLNITGNVTKEPELRFSGSGVAICNFSIAVNRKRGDEEETGFFDVVCFKTLAENVVESISKGMRVVVCGRLQQRSWETKEGQKRSSVEIVADEVSPSLVWASANVNKNGGNAPTGRPAPRTVTPPQDDDQPF